MFLANRLRAMAGGKSDPHWANVVALLHFNGTDGSTTFTDETGRVWTPRGNAQIDTSQSALGGASGYFDGTNDSISTPYSTDFALENSDFTIEVYVRLPSVTDGNDRYIINNRKLGTGWVVAVDTSGFVVFYSIGSGTSVKSTYALPANTFTHAAIQRYGSTMDLYLDGVLNVTNTAVTSAAVSDGPTVIGDYIYQNDSYRPHYGWIDELRVTKGVARYSGNFTPPTTEYPEG